jgi:hypothetical protein
MPLFGLKIPWTLAGRPRERPKPPVPAARRTRHRRAAVWLVAPFVLSQAALAVWIDQFSPPVRDPEYVLLRDRLKQRSAERPGRPVAVFLGSSRVAFGFDAARAAGDEPVVAFNFGVPGAGPFLLDVLHDRLSKDGVRPDLLLVEVMPPFFNAAGGKPLDHVLLDGARLTAGETADLFGYGVGSTRPFRRWAFARAVPIDRHRVGLRDQLGLDVFRPGAAAVRPLDDIDAFGYRPHPYPPDQWPALTALAHAQYDRFYAAFALSPRPFERLVRTVRRGQANGSSVVAVLMPEGSEFRRLPTPAAAEGVTDLIRRLREETGIAVIDARDWLDDAAFYDGHHMLPGGAAAFADRLRREVLKPAIE